MSRRVLGSNEATPPARGLRQSGQNRLELGLSQVAPEHSTAVSGNPQAAGAVDLHVGDEIIAQGAGAAFGLAHVFEDIAVEAIQTVFGPEPHEPRVVLRDGQHSLLREAVVNAEPLEAHG